MDDVVVDRGSSYVAVVAVGAYLFWPRKAGAAAPPGDASASWTDAPLLKAAAALPVKQYNDYQAIALSAPVAGADLSTMPISARTLPQGYTVVISKQENADWLASGGSGAIFYDPSKPGTSVRLWSAIPF